MGRRREVNPDDPPFLHRKGDVWYHVTGTRPRKWTALGTNKSAAVSRCEEIEQARMTVEQMYWHNVDSDLMMVIAKYAPEVSRGLYDELRALLRKVSER